MKKMVKIFCFIFGGLVVLLVVIAVALPFLLPPAKVKALIEQQAAAQLHRQVKLGKISISLWSGLGVDDFQLSESPDFSQGTFVSSEKFVVRPRLLPLLSKKFFIKEVKLVKPEVTIIRNADGKTYNFSSLTSSSASANAAPASAPTEKPSPLALVVSKASIESGKLKFIDRSPAKQSMEISPLNLTVRNFTLVGPVDLQTDFKAKVKGVEVKLDFAGMVNLVKGAVKIKSCGISSGASKISVGGEAHDFFAKEPAFDLSVDIQNLEPAFINAFAPLPPSIKLQGGLSGPTSVKGALSAIDFSTTLNFDKASVSSPGMFIKAAGVPMSFKAQGNLKNQQHLNLKELKLSLASFVLSVMGRVENLTGAAPEMNLKIQSNDFSVPELLGFLPVAAIPKDMKFAAPAKFACDVSGTTGAMNIQNIQFQMNPLKVTGAGIFKSTAKGANYAFDMKTNTFPLEEAVKMMPSLLEYQPAGKTSVVAKVVSAPQGPDVKGTAQLQGVSAVMKGAKLSNIVSTIDFTMKDAAGKLTADSITHENMTGKKLEAKWNLKDAADMAKISGTAKMRLGPGEFQNIQKLTADSKAARILFLPLSLLQKIGKATHGAVKIPSLDKITYKEMNGDYVFKSGVMNITSFNLLGDVGATMKGTVGLSGTQPLDLTAQMQLKAGLIGGSIAEAFENEQGQTTLNMIVKGTVDDPQVGVDMKDTKKKVMKAVKDQLGDKPEEAVKDLLKSLFKK